MSKEKKEQAGQAAEVAKLWVKSIKGKKCKYIGESCTGIQQAAFHIDTLTAQRAAMHEDVKSLTLSYEALCHERDEAQQQLAAALNSRDTWAKRRDQWAEKAGELQVQLAAAKAEIVCLKTQALGGSENDAIITEALDRKGGG